MGFLSQSTLRLLTVTTRKWSRVSHERLSQKIWGKKDECVLLQLSVRINSQNSSKLLMESGELNRLHEDFCQMNILKEASW